MQNIRVLYFFKNGAEELSCENLKADTFSQEIVTLPNANLVIQPGFYSLWGGGEIIYLKKEGLYRIMDHKNKRTFQVIVYRNDLWTLICSLAKIFLYGYEDNNLRLNEWSSRAIQRHILMECGPCSVSCYKLLQSLGVGVRVIGLNTVKGNEGHVINEVFLGGKWVIIDFINKIFFLDSHGSAVSLREIAQHDGGFEAFSLKPFCAYENISNNSGKLIDFSSSGVLCNYSFILDFLRHGDNLKKWFNQFKVFMLSDNPIYELYVLGKEEEIKNYSFYADGYHIALDKQAFLEKFYGE